MRNYTPIQIVEKLMDGAREAVEEAESVKKSSPEYFHLQGISTGFWLAAHRVCGMEGIDAETERRLCGEHSPIRKGGAQ